MRLVRREGYDARSTGGAREMTRTTTSLLAWICAAGLAQAGDRGAPLSVTGIALRGAIERVHSVQAQTVTLPKGADRDPRMIWFPLVLVFDGKRCLTGIYELEKLDRLTTTCATGNPTFADVLGTDAKPPFEPGKVLVLVAAPQAYRAMCEPCGRAHAAVVAVLVDKDISADVASIDLLLD